MSVAILFAEGNPLPFIFSIGTFLLYCSYIESTFDNADDAVKVAMCIKDKYHNNSPSEGGALDSHRLSIYLDQGNEYALKHCGASKTIVGCCWLGIGKSGITISTTTNRK